MSSMKASNSESVYPYLIFNPKAASMKTAVNSSCFNQPIMVLCLTHSEDPSVTTKKVVESKSRISENVNLESICSVGN